jgi:acetyl-CoA synthetase
MSNHQIFRSARDFLLEHRTDYEKAYRGFQWPQFETFNWALDWFDPYAQGNERSALHLVEDDLSATKLSFAQMSARSNQVANYLRAHGVKRGDRILMMLPNSVPIWETMLAAIKLGAVLIPATTLLTLEDLKDRFERGHVKHVITDAAGAEKMKPLGGAFAFTGYAVGARPEGWLSYEDAYGASASFAPEGVTRADDPMLLYFTSGTTAKPKLVLHTNVSYPVGHLSTMYWIGIKEGDVHQNISSPGWAKHAWSSFFAAWNAGATVYVHNYARFQAPKTLQLLERDQITTLCAPPTVWRMLVLEDLTRAKVRVRELLSAGEPLNPEVIEKVKSAWGVTIRDGYGQTETTCQIGNSPGQPINPGSMGRPMPGYRIALLDADGQAAHEGEISLPLSDRPMGLMAGYQDDPELNGRAMREGHYRTGDVATRDEKGYVTYVGRADDVFKSSDYRISPFELESALIEHPAIAETAVVPSPDALRGVVPKAFITLKPNLKPTKELAAEIFQFIKQRLAPYKRIRRMHFSELPKTISGKIRRVQLRQEEIARRKAEGRADNEFWLDDFPELG